MQVFLSDYFWEVLKVASYIHFEEDILVNGAFSDIVYDQWCNAV